MLNQEGLLLPFSHQDELEHWQVKMLQDFSPKELKTEFMKMAMKIMADLTEK